MTDQTGTIPAWQDGDPTMEAIAAAVYEHCEVARGTGLVIDDPRNIAAAAVAGIRDAARQAAGQLAAAKQQDTRQRTADELSARDSLYLYAMVGKVKDDSNSQMAVRKLDAYRDEVLAEARLSAALAEEDYQRVVRAASQLEKSLRARIAKLEATQPDAVAAPAVGLAAPTNHDTETEEDARHELYDYATITFHETGIPESVHAYVTCLIATYRTAILTAAADKAEAIAIRLHNAGETTASNGANEAMSALRRLAAGAES